MSVQIEFTNAAEFSKLLTDALENIVKAAQNALLKTMLLAEDVAKSLAPVRTGYLRSRIRWHFIDALSAELVCDAEYAAYVEYGTSRMMPRAYVRPAMYAAEQQLWRNLADEIERVLRG